MRVARQFSGCVHHLGDRAVVVTAARLLCAGADQGLDLCLHLLLDLGREVLEAARLERGARAREAAVVAMINNGKVNPMPAQADKLTDAQVNVLTAYVWGLSNKATVAAK